MTPDTWRRARSILAAALDEPSEKRQAYVAARCGDDVALRGEVESLLGAAGRPQDVHHVSSASKVPSHHDPLYLPSTQMGVTSAPQGATNAAADSSDIDAWGEFVILHEVGRGAFGVVYRAWDRTLKRDLALKVINVSRLPRSRGDILVREGQMLARVRHHHVVQVYGVQRRETEVGLVMEYIRGRTLAEAVAQTGPMSAQEASAIGVTLCDALAAVHRTGLVHRDVKAANVMREHGGRIVLMDFGAGHEFVPDGGAASVIAGTPVYMSPEVLAGMAASPASDVYSLGVLLFHLVTGEYPRSAGDINGAESAHEAGSRRLLATLRPDLPFEFVETVGRALAPSRQDRIASAIALRSELVRLKGRRSTSARSGLSPRRPAIGHDDVPQSTRSLLMPAIGIAGGMAALCSAVGFVTTLEFNYVLGRTGSFADEPWYAYPYWGAQALMPPVVHACLIVLLFNVGAFVAKLLQPLAPRVARTLGAVRATLKHRLEAAHLGDARTYSQAVCLIGVLALGSVLITYNTLLDGYMESVNSSPWERVASLGTDNEDVQSRFRFALSLVLVLLGNGALRSVRFAQDTRSPGSKGSVAGVAALMTVVVLLQAVPWRIVRKSEFREATWSGQRCFVIGEHLTERLLHCPAQSVPRNRVVAYDDPRLVLEATVDELFDAYNAGLSPRSP